MRVHDTDFSARIAIRNMFLGDKNREVGAVYLLPEGAGGVHGMQRSVLVPLLLSLSPSYAFASDHHCRQAQLVIPWCTFVEPEVSAAALLSLDLRQPNPLPGNLPVFIISLPAFRRSCSAYSRGAG